MRDLSMWLGALALVVSAGCGEAPAAPLPACDTLRAVRFVSLCPDGRARCALLSTAPEGAEPSGCEMTVVGTAGPRQVECAASCEQ